MKFEEETASQRYAIRAYGPGEVTVSAPEAGGERVLTESFVIGTGRLVPHWGPRDVDEVAPEHLDPILEQAPEVVLLGSGATLRFPPPVIQRILMVEHAVGMETMDTAAACRTFNILAGEGRSVVAALIL